MGLIKRFFFGFIGEIHIYEIGFFWLYHHWDIQPYDASLMFTGDFWK